MKPAFKTVMVAALKAALAAAAVNAVLFLIMDMAGIISDSVLLPDNKPMTVVPVIISSIVPSLLAGIVFFLLVKYTGNGRKIFTILAIILLLASFANPFVGLPGITIAMAVGLNLLHIVVVLSLLYFLGRTTRTQLA